MYIITGMNWGGISDVTKSMTIKIFLQINHAYVIF